MKTRIAVVALVLATGLALAGICQAQEETLLTLQLEDLARTVEGQLGPNAPDEAVQRQSLRSLKPAGQEDCNLFAGTLTCGSTVNGALTTSSCNTGGTANAYVEFYHFSG